MLWVDKCPRYFSKSHEQDFQQAHRKIVLVYLDDILVMSRTPEEHEQHLRIVLQILRENGLKAKLSKCESNKAELHFLGQVMEKTVLHWIP